MNAADWQTSAGRIERLVERAAALADTEARATALDLLRSVLDVHGAVFARFIELLCGAGEAGYDLLSQCCADPLIGGIFVLYGIHPLEMESRVRRALDEMAPRLARQGLEVAAVRIQGAEVHVVVEGAAAGCGSAAASLLDQLERRIREAAPDAAGVRFEPVPSPVVSGFVPLSALQPGVQERYSHEKSTA